MGKHRWKGELAKPIRPKLNRPLKFCRITDAAGAAAANEGMLKLYEGAIEKEWLKQLHRLMDEYGIADKSDFRLLSLWLALDLNIPGFRVDVPYFNRDAMPFRSMPFRLGKARLVVQDNRRGRRREWTEKRHRDLRRDLEEEKKRHGLSKDHDALVQLVHRPEWSRPPDSTQEQWVKTLKNQLAVARRLSKQASR